MPPPPCTAAVRSLILFFYLLSFYHSYFLFLCVCRSFSLFSSFLSSIYPSCSVSFDFIHISFACIFFPLYFLLTVVCLYPMLFLSTSFTIVVSFRISFPYDSLLSSICFISFSVILLFIHFFSHSLSLSAAPASPEVTITMTISRLLVYYLNMLILLKEPGLALQAVWLPCQPEVTIKAFNHFSPAVWRPSSLPTSV